ncbi:hypothetical protein [Ideonella livida]|uniref:Phage tail protein n=1 Tax=Ideonella livida TaxID=2707176 RepID=A0A7C9TIC5_9BURK|nr:hypothetical protein [Ideonella livida]NDY89705.1 hypothetical protein [Ideonella livida]
MKTGVNALLSAYDAAVARVDKARAAVTAPALSPDVLRMLTAGGAVASALVGNDHRPVPIKPPPGMPVLSGEKSAAVSFAALAELMGRIERVSLAWSSLYRIEVREASSVGMSGQAGPLLGLLAQSVSFGSRTIVGEATPLGGGYRDSPTGGQGTQIRVTTLDDSAGTLQRWFEAKADQVIHPDGTVGLPKDYLLAITVARLRRIDGQHGEFEAPHQRSFLVRAGACEEEHASSAAAELKVVTLTFEPWDTFAPAGIVRG